MRICQAGANAMGYLIDFLSMRQLWRSITPQGRRLLCLLFVFGQALPSETEGIG
jgi:hypothetical protein